MPRLTMSVHHQSVATAPLDLSTSARGRHSAGSGSPDESLCAGDARPATGGSPAPPASTGTDSSQLRCSADTGHARKRPAEPFSSSKLPFRKRPIQVEPDPQKPPPDPAPAGSVARRFPAEERGPTRLEEGRVAVSPVTRRPVEEAGHSPEAYSCCMLPFVNYSPYPVYRVPASFLETQHHPLHLQTDNLLAAVSLATHQDEDGDTPLHIAVVKGESSIVHKLIQLLLMAHRNLDVYNNLRQTPLHLAVITRQADLVEALLRAGADPSILDRHGHTALHLCCEYNQIECLSVVLSFFHPSSTCLEVRNFEGLSPLHLAVLHGHQELAKMLLDAGADINAMDIKSGQSPLMHAVESNNADMVHFLIESGCDVNSQSYSGNTALHVACGRGLVDTVRLLLKSGADSSLKNYHNDTPMMVAKNKKISDVLRGRGSKQIRDQDQHGSIFIENGSPISNHSRGSSPQATPLKLHLSSSHSPHATSALFPPY